MPRTQFLQLGDRRVSDAGKNVGQPHLRIDIVELCAHDQRGHEGGTISPTICSGEEPGLSIGSEC